eukprot:scaffold294920_cov59-Attheya_sp.AAC.5
MVKQLEVSLYRSAPSFEAYADTSTLKHRLQLLAIEIARKTNQSKDQNQQDRRSRSEPQPYGNGMHPPQHQNMQRTGSAGTPSPFNGSSSSNGRIPSPSMKSSSGQDPHQHMSQQRQMAAQGRQQQSRGRQVVQMDDINPMISANSSSPSPSLSRSSLPLSQNSASGSVKSAGSGSFLSPSMGSNVAIAPTNTSMEINKNDPDWQSKIRHKQQRLLLLHHSCKCPHEDGRCTASPHCADMKRLWKHMSHCDDNNCRVSHCFSSRSVLSHYRKCKDQRCPACGPVRDSVRNAQSKASQGVPSKNSDSSGRHHRSSFGGQSQPIVSGSNTQMQNVNMTSSSPEGMDPALMTSKGSGSLSQQPRSQPMPPPTPGASVSAPTNYSMSSDSFNVGNMNGSLDPSNRFRSNQTSSDRDPLDLSPPSSRSHQPDSDFDDSGKKPAGGDAEWQSKIKHKQRRLLLLRHASKCQYEDGACPVTPFCPSMKKLWKHIADCKDQLCKVQHCVSSRYVLSHYKRCKDVRCPACGPVRETIRKSHEKEKLRQVHETSSTPATNGSYRLGDPKSSGGTVRTPQNGDFAGRHSRSPYDGYSNTSNFNGDGSGQHHPKRSKTLHASIDSGSSHGMTPGSVNSHQSRADVSRSNRTPSSMKGSAASSARDQAISSKEKESASKSSSNSAPGTPSKPAEEFSLLNSFSVEAIEKHIASLNRTVQLPPAKLKSRCLEVLKGMQTHQNGWVFNTPVDPIELGLPDYFLVIKRPMDLGTIQKKVEAGSYHSIGDFASDVRLTFDNAMMYNEDGSVVYTMADELRTKFIADNEKLMTQLKKEEKERRENDRACSLCGCEKLLFEPPVFFCNGNCQSKRIRRNSHFYIGGSNQYFWCNQCFNELDDKRPIEMIDVTLKKDELKKKKNDEVHEESWVQCDTCERWIHQICGLFNTRQNKEHKSEYCCPQCTLDKRKSGNKPSTHPPSAADLPRTMLSEWLERHVKGKVEEHKMSLAKDKAGTQKISLEEAKKTFQIGGPVIIRQVTSTDRKHEKIDGVDVILFALYVYEHGANNPAPNQRTVYISYLDSVHFMRPRKMRTFIYHEILIAYLDYARQKGYLSAHIWACPPLKGDDYIFYAKPEDQKTPKDGRLRQWYIDMLVECQRRGVVGRLTNMFDLYLADEKLDATSIPYLEGDYFPGEAENIIKELEEGGGKKKGGSAGNKSKKKKISSTANGNSKSKNRGGTRSSSTGEDIMFNDAERDPVMIKLGQIIQPMKDSFIVAFLTAEAASKENFVVPKEIEEYRKEAKEKGDKSFAADLTNGDTSVASSTGKKRDSQGTIRLPLYGGLFKDLVHLKDTNGDALKLVNDDLEELDCEFFNNRQAFLNLCRGNHYQFDELRRAKHTSMMVLWHLHNRDAPKFVQQCASCSREILSGMRYHCSSCTDFDLCEDCYKNPNASRGACTHTLESIPVEGENRQNNSGSELTEAQRKERQRNLQLHIQLIEHASRCISPKCTSSNCAKMKSYLKHGSICKAKASGGCKICKRIWTLLRIHAQQCKGAVCPIPQCMAIRERIRQLAKQQQAMDDRRRQEMNRHYRMALGQSS